MLDKKCCSVKISTLNCRPDILHQKPNTAEHLVHNELCEPLPMCRVRETRRGAVAGATTCLGRDYVQMEQYMNTELV